MIDLFGAQTNLTSSALRFFVNFFSPARLGLCTAPSSRRCCGGWLSSSRRMIPCGAQLEGAVLDHVVRVVIDPPALMANAFEVLLAARSVCGEPVHVVLLGAVELVMEGQSPARLYQRRRCIDIHLITHCDLDLKKQVAHSRRSSVAGNGPREGLVSTTFPWFSRRWRIAWA